MKKLLYIFLAVSIIFAACKKEEDNNPPTSPASIIGGWDCTTVTIDSSVTFSYMGITIDSLSSSGSFSMTAAEADFVYGLDFLGGPTSGNIYVYEDPITVTDTSTWEIVGDSLVIDEGDITFKYIVTSNALSLIQGASEYYDDGMGMEVDYNYNQTINFTRNNGFTTNSTNQRKSNTPWFNKTKLINRIK
jgi:hypothetical protein